ncbi:hypothetical protein CLIB1423_01S11650 [[Candida] railenensis]|uniref:DNA replication regulator Sld3 C-terminal domain-containing protein n=1 Tax=[Candida] railenensis TaxID=45579 RepID=A0A9P0QL36_9ASCO|nr:hypothetical protein CLIB1423_01S11650 [[Candida] railenensis]
MDDIGETSKKESNASNPISFTVESESGSHSLSIKIVKVISRIHMFDLVQHCDTQKDLKLLRIKDTVMSNLTGNAFIVKLSVRNSDDINGVLYNIKQNVFGLVQNIAEPRDVDLRTSEIRHPEIEVQFQDSAKKYIKNWTIVGDAVVCAEPSMEISEDLKKKLSSFSMKPISSPVKHTLSPGEFLESRYYTTFYSQNTPLSYFPKTALTRFKNMCETFDSASTELRKLCMSIDELDKRHTGRFGILTQEKNHVEERSKEGSEIERQCKLEFIERHSDLFQPVDDDLEMDQKLHTNLSNLATELKIRETQLQMLILLELFASRATVSEEEFFTKNVKIQEENLKKMQLQTKQSLVRQKKKKKIVPTFLGMGVTSNVVSGIESNSDEDIFIYTTLNSLIDRMGIWDTLSERKGSEDSSYEFLAYVLVPYYNKRIPITIKYIIDKIKGSNLKFDRKSSSGNASRTTSRRSSNSGSTGGSADNSTNASSKSSPRRDLPTQENNDAVLLAAPKISEQNLNNRKQRKALLKDRRPLLTSSKTSTGILGNDLLPAFSIKRSKSSVMSSSRSLEKRQVDVSKSFSESNDSRNTLSRKNSSSEMQLSQSQPQTSSTFIFGNSKKIRVSSGPSYTRDETLQVAATPIKKKPNKISNVLSSSNKASANSTAQVSATPNTDRHIIIQTPEMAPPSKKKLTIYEKFLETTDVNNNLNKSDINSLVASSPGSPNSISPANVSIKRKRPGEPVSAQDSPFFGSNFQGSPINNNKKVDTDDDEDSDYERLLARISPPKKKTIFGRASKAKHY